MKYVFLIFMSTNIAILLFQIVHGASVPSLAFTLLCAWACWYGYKNKLQAEQWKD